MRALAIVMITCSALVLAGCGYYRWEKQGASSDDFKADQDSCIQSGAKGFAFNDCMQQHGWTFRD